MKKKTNNLSKRLIFLIVVVLLFGIFYIWKNYFINESDYAVVEEDKANYCTENTTTLVGSTPVEVKIHRDNLAQYEKVAKASGWCYRIISYPSH